MAPRSNLEMTWLPIIMQKAKKIGKPYTDGELKTIAGEFLKRLPQNVDNTSFNEILNQTFTDFDNLKANRGAQVQQPQAPQQPVQPAKEEKPAELSADQKAEMALTRNFTQDIRAFIDQNNLDSKIGDSSDVADISEEVVNRYMFYKKKVGKELTDKQYLRIIRDVVREKLNNDSEEQTTEETPVEHAQDVQTGVEDGEQKDQGEENPQTSEQQSDETDEEQAVEEVRDPLTGLTAVQICKVGDNLEKLIRNGLKGRYGYMMNLDYKIVRDPGARLSLNYNDTVNEFKESWSDSGYGDGFSDAEIEKIIKSNVLVIYVLKERVLSDVVSLIRENPAFRGNSGLAISSASIPNMADVPYTSMNVRFSQRDYNGKIVANIGVSVFGGKFRPFMKSGIGFLSDIFKMTSDLANRR